MAPKRTKHAFVRPWMYWLLAGAGLVTFALVAIAFSGDTASALEVDVFRTVNGVTDAIEIPVWVLMQGGNLLVIPLGMLVAGTLREPRLVGAFAASGLAKYFGARVIKGEFVRHRPAVLLDDVSIKMGSSDSGLGFVSGHAIIAVSVAVIVYPYLRSAKARAFLWIVTLFVVVGRVYAGAHFPLDVIGGAGVGLAIGALTNLIFGVPRRDELAESPIPAN